MKLLTFERGIWLATLTMLPIFASSQSLKNDTVKIKALIPSYTVNWNIFPILKDDSSGLEVTAIIIRGYAVYGHKVYPPDLVLRFNIDLNSIKDYYPRTFLNLLHTNKSDTIKNYYDYKEINW